MYAAIDSMEQPAEMTAKWQRPRASEMPKMLLSLGRNLSLILSVEELRDLSLAIQEAFREIGLDPSGPPEQTDN
jgi:hypothetical protein